MVQQIMSIRLSADGLSFWTGPGPGIEAGESNLVSYPIATGGRSTEESVYEAVSEYRGILTARSVEIPQTKVLYADTADMLLVPEELFDEKDIDELMAVHGYGPAEDFYTVCSKPICGTISVMRLCKAAVECLGKQLGEFSVAHMLQYNLRFQVRNSIPDISIYLSPTLCHITAYGKDGLLLAESYPYHSVADIQYFISAVVGNYGLEQGYPVYIRGERAEETVGKLCRAFKGAVCG